MFLKAVRDCIIVRLEYAEHMRGLIVPEKAKQYSGNMWGIVVAVGPECKDDLKPGDSVAYRRHEGFLVRYKGEDLWSLQSKWVVAKIEKKRTEKCR